MQNDGCLTERKDIESVYKKKKSNFDFYQFLHI